MARVSPRSWQYALFLFSFLLLIVGYIGLYGPWGKYGALIGAVFCSMLLMKIIHIIITSAARNIAGKIVGFLVIGFIPLDALLVLLLRGWKEAVIVCSLLMPALLSKRFFYTA
jgi:hypothetical protein